MEGAVMAAKPVIKVAAVCGSLRKASFNRGLIRAAIELSKESVIGLQIEHVDIAPLPFLNTDLEVDGTFPAPVEAFRKKILEADSILFASPEYNYSLTGITNSQCRQSQRILGGAMENHTGVIIGNQSATIVGEC